MASKKKSPAIEARQGHSTGGDQPVRVGRVAKQKISGVFLANPKGYKEAQQRGAKTIGFDRSAGPNRNPKPLFKVGRAWKGTNIAGVKYIGPSKTKKGAK